MKKGLQIIFLFSLMMQTKPASAVHVDTAIVYSQYYTSDSSRFFLIAQVRVGSNPCDVYSMNTDDSSNRKLTVICYMGGPAAITCDITDTFDLGVAKNGSEKIIAVFQTLTGPQQCTGSWLNQDTFEFVINTELNSLFDVDSKSRPFFIYPNPTTAQLFIQSTEEIQQINIYNTTGSLVMGASSMVDGQLSIINLPTGVYIAEIKTKEGTARKRWVKM